MHHIRLELVSIAPLVESVKSHEFHSPQASWGRGGNQWLWREHLRLYVEFCKKQSIGTSCVDIIDFIEDVNSLDEEASGYDKSAVCRLRVHAN